MSKRERPQAYTPKMYTPVRKKRKGKKKRVELVTGKRDGNAASALEVERSLGETAFIRKMPNLLGAT